MKSPLRTHWEQVVWLLSTDFCPEWNRYLDWLKNPFWLLVLTFAVSLMCGIFVNAAILVVSGGLLLVTGLGLVYPRLSLWGIECEIHFERSRCRCGQPTEVELTVTNRWPFPVWGLALHRGFTREITEKMTAEQGTALAQVPGWSRTTYRWSFRPELRGIYPLEMPQVETAFPFGLWTAEKEVTASSSLIVWPETVSLEGTPESLTLSPHDDQLSDRRAGDFGDTLGTRGFRAGDSLRRVHWAQTARHGRMIVCEKQAPALAGVRVNVDLSSDAHDCTQSDNSLEWAIQIVASICESLQHQHGKVECLLGNERLILGNGVSDLRRLMDSLAHIPHTGLSNSNSPTRSRSSLLEIHVVTSRSQFPQVKPAKHHQQVILIELPEHEQGNLEIVSSCSCESPWIRLQPHEQPATVLPLHWRKACYVA